MGFWDDFSDGLGLIAPIAGAILPPVGAAVGAAALGIKGVNAATGYGKPDEAKAQGGGGGGGAPAGGSFPADPYQLGYYGGSQAAQMGAYEDTQRRAEVMHGRQGPTMDAALWNQDRAMDFAARQRQAKAADQYWLMANGQGPSVANALYQRGINDQQAAFQSMAASARGGAANAIAAQRAAMEQSANLGRRSLAEVAALRAQEQQQAMAGYAGAANALRQADAARVGQSAYWASQQAGLDAQQRARNDAMYQFERGMGHDIQTGTRNAMTDIWRAQAGYAETAADRRSRENTEERGQNYRLIGGLTGAGAGVGAALLQKNNSQAAAPSPNAGAATPTGYGSYNPRDPGF